MKSKRADQPESKRAEESKPESNGRGEVLQVTSLDQLQSACEQVLHIKFLFPKAGGAGTVALIPVRMLRPDESEHIELILREGHPPMKEVTQSDGSKRMEFVNDEASIAKAAHIQKVARAVALWWACPLFQNSDQGRKIIADMRSDASLKLESGVRERIFEFVQSKFTEGILMKLYNVAMTAEFQLEELVNFTTPAA